MKKQLAHILAVILIFTNFGAQALPEEDREAMVKFYKQVFPKIKFEDYVFGSLSLSQDAKEQYDNMMEFPPFVSDIRNGGIMWDKQFKNGAKFASCFKSGGVNVVGGYPHFDDKSGRVVTFENAINACLKANGESEIKYGSKEMATLTSYARSLSDGSRVNIKIKSPGAMAAYEKGKQFYYQRQGQLNFSCSTCHIDFAGKRIRGEQLSMMVGQATHWPVFRAGTEAVTLQTRFVGCQKNTRAEPKEINSPEYNNLEFFLTYMSNGLKLQSPVFRK